MTPAPNTAAAFGAAAGQWNSVSSTSGVSFDVAPPGQTSDIQVQLTSDSTGTTGGCASYSAGTGRVAYGETFLQAVQSISAGITIFAHELGHALGLNDAGLNPTPPSIMIIPRMADHLHVRLPKSQLQAYSPATLPVFTLVWFMAEPR